jgi:hypothetical protein
VVDGLHSRGRRNTEGGCFPIADAVGHLESKIRLAYDILREASAIGLQAAMNHSANSIADFEVAGVVLAALGDYAGVVTPNDGLRWAMKLMCLRSGRAQSNGFHLDK